MDADRQRFCERLQADTYDIAQDCVNALLLCECVYKACDGGPYSAAVAITQWKQQFGETCTLTRLQCTLPHVQHRYVLGSARDALYVALQGTKYGRDLITDLNFWFNPVWEDTDEQLLSAHRGFLERSRQVPAEALLAWARQHGRRLIFCGHSLGARVATVPDTTAGAVAVLCTLRLLRGLGDNAARSNVCCITFGMPAVGNAALADHVSLLGWHRCFTSFVLPEDPVPRLMAAAAASPGRALAAAEAEAAMGQAQPGTVIDGAAVLEPQPASHAADDSQPAAAQCAAAGMPGYWHRWNMLRNAALASIASLKQALPLQSRFVHFGNYCTLTRPMQKEQQAEMHTTAAGSGLLLAGHRMPSYRARVLGHAGRLTGAQSSAGAAVALSDTLAPQLAAVTASAQHPPLPPPQPSRSAVAAAVWPRMQAKRNHSWPGQWLSTGTGRNADGGASSRVRLRVSLEASENLAALHSIISARLRQPGRASLPMSWALHIGSPVVQADQQQSTDSIIAEPGRMRLWLTSIMSSARSKQQLQQQQSAERRLVAEIVLPAAQAQQLLAQPQLSLKLRSDFAEAAVTVQLRHQLLWVLGGSTDAIAQLLGPSVAGAAPSKSTTSPARLAAASSNAWRRSTARFWPPWATSAVHDSSGKLPIGLQYLHFSSATARLDQHCATLLKLLRQQPSAGVGSGSSYAGHGTAHPLLWQKLLDAARVVWMPHPAGSMLQAEQLPQLLLCMVTPQDSQLDGVGRTCAAAAAAGMKVLIAALPLQADSLIIVLERYCTSGSPPVVLQLEHLAGDGPHQSNAIDVLEQLYRMMQRIDARSSVSAEAAKL